MTEVLYCPINNQLFLFTGAFEVDAENKILKVYLQTQGKRIKVVEAINLIHIGWL